MENEDIKTILGKKVRYYRNKKGYTQAILAEMCDLSPRYISDIENANGNIRIETLQNIARCLEVKSYQLLLDEELPSE